ncbi:hypothetical protein ACHAXT_001016 [Thalassiosira profunda]
MSSQSVVSLAAAGLGFAWFMRRKQDEATAKEDSVPTIVLSKDTTSEVDHDCACEICADELDLSTLPCIADRRSIFPNAYKKDPPPLEESIVQSLLDAALYGPFHGKCCAGSQHPAKFVVLGKHAMVEMQQLTLRYYDKNWQQLGSWPSEQEYQSFRKQTEDEITGRWGPVSYMIAIVMRRQAGKRRFPEWEEAAAVACAVQNMHIQSTKFPKLACYWSSWHDAARDSEDMKEFLGMESEDKCLGFFIIAQAKNPSFRPKRIRDRSLMAVDWRA